jgi:Chaperone of endosialidase
VVTTGNFNHCFGYSAGSAITSGGHNTLVGLLAANNLVSGTYNTVVGANLGGTNYTGAESNNIILGGNPGITGENNVMRLGYQGSGTNQQNICYIAGIFGSTAGLSGIPVVVDNTGLMGTIVSSRRYKENISDMDDVSRPVMDLRPVTFNYKNDRTHERRFGLIAEEVDEIIPDLVVRNKEGDPESIKYHDLPVLLLNEIQRQHNVIAELSRRLDRLEGRAKYESKS